MTLTVASNPTEGIEEKDLTIIKAACGFAMDGPQRANSGHPGAAMALAPLGWFLFRRVLNYNPHQLNWPNRDRFVLSCGHACMLQYTMMHFSGMGITREDILNFRQWDSRTPGHPESFQTAGVETTTGPLGQGIANAVGMAVAQKHLAARFNRPDFPLFDNQVVAIASDGDLMEGVCLEACSLAGQWGLDNLIVFYDDNNITIEGRADLAFNEDTAAKFTAMNWQVLEVENVWDWNALAKSVEAAKQSRKPTLVIIKTVIGWPAPHKKDTPGVHGSPLGSEELSATKALLGIPEEEFWTPECLAQVQQELVERGSSLESDWNELVKKYEKAHPEAYAELQLFMKSEMDGLVDSVNLDIDSEKPMATRSSSGLVIQQLTSVLPQLMGGSADLAPSTKTWMNECGTFAQTDYSGRNIHFGIREHGMAAIANGMASYGGVIPFVATFFVFTDYMRPAMRLAAMMKKRVVYVMTHDSIGLGEDGPTHQPIEHLASLRAIPNLTVVRPADTAETLAAWKLALKRQEGPTCLVLSRQNLPQLKGSGAVEQGAYILKDSGPKAHDIILMASGSEVEIALATQEELGRRGYDSRVVSFPCWEQFLQQDESYQKSVLPEESRCRVVIEAGIRQGWERFAGSNAVYQVMEGYGASAPYQEIYERFGFTARNIADQVEQKL